MIGLGIALLVVGVVFLFSSRGSGSLSASSA